MGRGDLLYLSSPMHPRRRQILVPWILSRAYRTRNCVSGMNVQLNLRSQAWGNLKSEYGHHDQAEKLD